MCSSLPAKPMKEFPASKVQERNYERNFGCGLRGKFTSSAGGGWGEKKVSDK